MCWHRLITMVYESTADGFVSENALAGAIPTEIGQLTQLLNLDLSFNQLTGASKNSLHCNFGIRVNFRLTNVQSNILQVKFRPSWAAAVL